MTFAWRRPPSKRLSTTRYNARQPVSVSQRRRRHLQPAKREDFKPVSPLSSQRGSTEPIRDLESRLLGKIPAADRSCSGPDARKRVGAAGGDFVPRCKRGDGLFPASGARQPTRNLEAHTGLAATVPQTNKVP